MKPFSILILLFSLCSANVFAWSVTLSGPSYPVKGETYDYRASYTLDETNRHKNLERVEYHWTIVGEAVTAKKTDKSSSVASVTMHDLNGAKMPDDPETWPGGYVICMVTLYFKDGTKESNSYRIKFTLIP